MKPLFFISMLFPGTLLCCMSENEGFNGTTDIACNEITRVHCKADTSQSYMVYLPAQFDTAKTWPVIFCFDPEGKGRKPVDSLKLSSEKYGYIVAGSNNIRNGVKNLNYLLSIFIEDVLQNYPVDENRIYACGFSGGGRISASLALGHERIKGFISCGAGLQSLNTSGMNRKIDGYILAGQEDFNYLEAIYSIQYHDPKKLNIIVDIFNGKHTWPPSAELDKAVLWFTLNAMKEGIIEKNEDLIKNAYDKTLQSVHESETKDNILEELRENENGIKMLDGLINIGKLKKDADRIMNSGEYKNALARFTESAKEEYQLMSYYTNAFYTKDTLWWKNEIRLLNNRSWDPINVSRSLTYKRILNFLRLMCYMISDNALNKNDLILAENVLHTYKLLDPVNPDMHYFRSVLLLKQNKTGEAKTAFKRSLELGFSDLKKAESQLTGDFFKE